MAIASDLTDLIGGTPLLRLDRFCEGVGATVLAKCEFLNPYSVKDRTVLFMIREAERDGRLAPGGTIVEATSGNTGIAIASQAAVKGYRAILVMSELSSLERRQMLVALGAELVITPAAEGTKGARAKAKEIAAETGALYICQHDNPANPLVHLETTAEEIWSETSGGIDVFVAAAGTTGTLVGISRALKPRKPELRVVGVEPAEAPFLSRGEWSPHKMNGAAPGFLPTVYEEEAIDEFELVPTDDAMAACRELARTEGLLVGVTSGGAALAARRIAARPESAGQTIVCVMADTGERYLSMGFFG
ncbi:MAG: cysteine synthase family protein [Planctomycetota bacterium]